MVGMLLTVATPLGSEFATFKLTATSCFKLLFISHICPMVSISFCNVDSYYYFLSNPSNFLSTSTALNMVVP